MVNYFEIKNKPEEILNKLFTKPDGMWRAYTYKQKYIEKYNLVEYNIGSECILHKSYIIIDKIILIYYGLPL